MKTRRQSSNGLTLIEVMIVVAVLAVLVALLLPAMRPAQRRSDRINCVNNLKQVSLSFRQWAQDYSDKFPMEVLTNSEGAMEWAQQGIAWPVFQVMSNELNTPKVLFCPADSNKKRIMANTFGSAVPGASSSQISFTNNQNLSYFVSLDAIGTQANLLLTGDSHFEVAGNELSEGLQKLQSQQRIGWAATRHENRNGNLCFVDGSVRSFASKELPAVFQATGLATNRLVLP